MTATAGKGTEKVTVDDASAFLAKFAPGKNVAPGAYATIEATRLAPGHKNYNYWEINGTEGSLSFCFERMNELQYCNRNDAPDKPGFKTILCTESSHPYFGAWWPPGGGLIMTTHARVRNRHPMRAIPQRMTRPHGVASAGTGVLRGSHPHG